LVEKAHDNYASTIYYYHLVFVARGERRVFDCMRMDGASLL